MARSRSLPTNLFEDPDFFEQNSDTQVFLIGLVLLADDYGRGLAHVGLLARKMNKDERLIEQALAELERCKLVQCYQVDRHRYYSLCRWQEWETLSKPTPSKYPAPPGTTMPTDPQNSPEFSRISLGNPGNFGEAPSEGEGEQEREGKRTEREEEVVPPNVVTFPKSRSGDSDNTALSEQTIVKATQQIAHILKLPETSALSRLVAEYLDNPALSLLGQADAAREWIDDQQRNRKGIGMSLAFFRRWLNREREHYLQWSTNLQQATGTTGRGSTTSMRRKQTKEAGITASDPDEVDPYQAFVDQRVQEVYAGAIAPQAQKRRTHETTP